MNNILSQIIIFTFIFLFEFNKCSNSLKKNQQTTNNNNIHIKFQIPGNKKRSHSKRLLYAHLFVKVTENCNNNTCSNPTGYCLSENVCKCAKGFANAPEFTQDKNKFCQYEQKKQYYALYLEIVFFFGIGHLYSHRIIISFIKALFFIITLFVRSIYVSYQNEKISPSKVISQIGYYTLLLFYILYHMLDLMMFYLNKYTDGYGIPLTRH